jgi:hypothetical protein
MSSANSRFVVICCELESFLSAMLVIDRIPDFMYVQAVSITGKGDDNGFFKKHEC